MKSAGCVEASCDIGRIAVADEQGAIAIDHATGVFQTAFCKSASFRVSVKPEEFKVADFWRWLAEPREEQNPVSSHAPLRIKSQGILFM